jgi:hypothetical protein
MLARKRALAWLASLAAAAQPGLRTRRPREGDAEEQRQPRGYDRTHANGPAHGALVRILFVVLRGEQPLLVALDGHAQASRRVQRGSPVAHQPALDGVGTRRLERVVATSRCSASSRIGTLGASS